MQLLLNFNGNPVWNNEDGSYLYRAPFAVDSDGTGPGHGDPDQDKNTSLRVDGVSLNASKVPYGVEAPAVIRAVPGIVLGCRGQIRNPRTGKTATFVVGDVSNDAPTRKLGEGSIALAVLMDVDPDPVTGGSDELFEWTIWPGQAAVIDGITYPLQRFGT